MRWIYGSVLAALVGASCVIPDVETSSKNPGADDSESPSGSSGKRDKPDGGRSSTTSTSTGGDDESGGEPNPGIILGGAPGEPASGGAGAAAGTSGVGGSGGASAKAVAKFCSPISITAADALRDLKMVGEVVDLELGTGSQAVTLSVSSYHECTPKLGSPCKAIPAGKSIPYRLVHHNSQIVLTSGVLDITAGDAVLFSDVYYSSGAKYYQVSVEHESMRFDAKSCPNQDYTALFPDESR